MNQQISTLREQVSTLFSDLHDLRAHVIKPVYTSSNDYSSRGAPTGRIVSPLYNESQEPRAARRPHFQGPTSSAFNFDVAKSSLQTMGIAEDGMAGDTALDNASPAPSPVPTPTGPTIHPSKDLMWSLKHEDAIRLLQVYEEEIDIYYPLISIAKVSNETNLLYSFMNAAVRTGFANKAFPGTDALQDDNTSLLKMVLAIALAVEGSGRSDLGHYLYMAMKPLIELRLWGPVDIKTIKLFTLAVWFSALLPELISR